MTRHRKKSSCSVYILLALTGICLLTAVMAAALTYFLPAQAEVIFGPPAPYVDRIRLIAYAAILTTQSEHLLQPAGSAGAPVEFDVLPGESTASIVDNLWRAGLISDPGAFSTYLSYSGLDTSIQAGTYELSPSMTPLEIAASLQDATPAEVVFNIIPGWRLEEIAAALPTSGLSITPNKFLAAAQSPPSGNSIEGMDGVSLEGFFLPGEYVFPRETSVENFIQTITTAFDTKVDLKLRQGFERQGLNLYQAVTLASIVEREAMDVEEMPMIASVFYNRLAIGMKLDSDPTVQYAIGFQEAEGVWWKNPLSLNDLQIESLYNTYLYPGLPPGPIANPSINALQSVAFPAETPYYYFRASCDGSGRHEFSVSFEEHLNKSCPE